MLEVGAGTGKLWGGFDNTDTRLTLTDFSPAMCEKLREIPGAAVKQCDAAELPFPDGTFDVAIANHMLYHLDDPDKALQELARVLRPDGKLIVTLNSRDHIQEIIDIGEKIGRGSDILKRARITAETAPDHIAKYLTVVSTERVPGSFEVPTADPVVHYLNSWGDGPLETEAETTVRSIIEPHLATDGFFRITKNMVLFTAQRNP